MATAEDKPNILILGGVGFIGRNLVHYLVKNELAKKIRVADKMPPAMAWLNEEQKQSFQNEKVEFRQANLKHEKSVEGVFTDAEPFDVVVNLAAETKYGLDEAIYEEGVYRLSVTCAQQAAKMKVKRFIEFSSGQMTSSEKNPCTEDTSKLDPWTLYAKSKLKVERELAKIEGLNYIIVRPAVAYGIGDRVGITPRLVIGAVYQHLDEKMGMLWTKDLKMNTVHVEDVARAVWYLCSHGNTGEVYHLVDKNETTQGKVCELVSSLFGIRHGFLSALVSEVAKQNIPEVVFEINEKHIGPWAELCKKHGIDSSPLTPYLDAEHVYNKHLHMQGKKLEGLGFEYVHPQVTKESLTEVLNDYSAMHLFPPNLVS